MIVITQNVIKSGWKWWDFEGGLGLAYFGSTPVTRASTGGSRGYQWCGCPRPQYLLLFDINLKRASANFGLQFSNWRGPSYGKIYRYANFPGVINIRVDYSN